MVSLFEEFFEIAEDVVTLGGIALRVLQKNDLVSVLH